MATAALIAGALAASPGTTPGASAAPATQRQASLVKAMGLDKDVKKSKYDTYVVVLKSDPLLAKFGRSQLDTAAARSAQDAIVASHDAVAKAADVSTNAVTQDLTVAANAFAVNVDHAAAVRLAADPKVAAVVPDDLRQAQGFTAAAPAKAASHSHDRRHAVLPSQPRRGGPTGSHHHPPYTPGGSSSVPTEEDFLDLTGPGEAYDSGIDGTGVLVGVIDTGIWPEHPSFADDGTLPEAPVLAGDSCQFGNTAANPNDKDFTCNNKLVGARDMMATYRAVAGAEPDEFVSARDDEGHGTHTASTAAGDANVKAYINGKYVDTTSGIAPRAQIIAYKALGNGGGFSSDLSSAIDQAVADGVDVINYSVGGGPNLAGIDAISFLFASNAGVYAAVSAGNDGPDPATIGGPADAPWVTAVAASTEPRFYQGTVRLGNGRTLTGASISGRVTGARLVDAARLGNPLCDPEKPFSSSVAGAIVICTRGLEAGRVATSLTVKNAGGVGEILANVDVPNQDNLFTDNFWVPTVHMDQKVADQARAYVARAGQHARASIVDTGKIVQQPWKAPSVTVFSSRGPSPTAASIVKPDISAPGIQVLAGASPYTDEGFVQGTLFQAIAGTSMSAPQIAGIYALVKQAHPTWTPAEAKSALQTTASLDITSNDRRTPANPFERGAGQVDPGKVDAPGLFNPGLVYDARTADYVGFLCEPETALAEALAGASCDDLAAAGLPTDAENLNLATIGIEALAGSETVKRTVTNVSGKDLTVTADTSDAPQGYSVSVSPQTLTVPAGGKASFQVTITNTGAPVGAWRFGNLTWKGAGYTVNSAIAVRGSSIGAPAQVTGSGASGTVDVPVKFGYDGPYSAVPSGLVASQPLTGSVVQDPDQTYPSSDDGQGGVASVPITIGDTSYWRIQYVAPGDDDIDLYLLDSTGKVVAQSTAGGTDELIELSHPAAGSYTLKVHGWQVAAGTTHQFSIDNWVVPTGPGSLTVTSAPTQATTAATGTVSLAWSGATPAGTYYGAVDHTNGTDELAQTVVEVTGAD